MATITPLLDTLLHEVLGRRMDAPSKPQLTPPVAPVYPSKAAQAVQADPRLQSRGGTAEVQNAGRTPWRQTGLVLPDSTGREASTYTRLSPAAHLISAVLARFPAPPSVIRPAGPLLPSPQLLLTEPGSVDQGNTRTGSQMLQERLSSSIRDSGLFYESHLRAWFRGKLPLEHLLRQPQMQGRLVETTPSSSQNPPAAPSAQSKAAAPTSAAREAPDIRPESLRSPIPLEQSETLQSLLRHQLELLVSPVLRWEGEVWPGLFMSLIVDLPPQEEVSQSQEEDGSRQAGDECGAELELVLDGLGSVHARLKLKQERLNLTMTTAAPGLYALMDKGREALLERLSSSGLTAELQLVLKGAPDDEGL